MKLIYIGIHREGESTPVSIITSQLLVGCAGKPNSLRGFVITVMLPYMKHGRYDDWMCDTWRFGWRVLRLTWWFRLAAGGKLYTDIKPWMVPI